jgi:hypothetical protein
MYLNDGDWVESCTALVEHQDGKLELVDWVARNKLSLLASSAGKISASKTQLMQNVASEIAAAAQREPEIARAVPARV